MGCSGCVSKHEAHRRRNVDILSHFGCYKRTYSPVFTILVFGKSVGPVVCTVLETKRTAGGSMYGHRVFVQMSNVIPALYYLFKRGLTKPGLYLIVI